MSDAVPKTAIGRTFTDVDEARGHASALVQQGMKATLIGPVRHSLIAGPTNQTLPWPPNPTEDYYIVIGTNSGIETPPGPKKK